MDHLFLYDIYVLNGSMKMCCGIWMVSGSCIQSPMRWSRMSLLAATCCDEDVWMCLIYCHWKRNQAGRAIRHSFQIVCSPVWDCARTQFRLLCRHLLRVAVHFQLFAFTWIPDFSMMHVIHLTWQLLIQTIWIHFAIQTNRDQHFEVHTVTQTEDLSINQRLQSHILF